MPDADDLYGLPLDRFVPGRTALARELRGAGRREEASQVGALRKPSVAAWAVNQLVRTQRRAFDELLEAGDALRAAHDDVLAGRGDAESLRRAVAGERAAVDTLAKAARGLLSSEGHELSPTIVDRVADTLHAAALDDDAREQVRAGRLERELRHIGLGMMAAGVSTGAGTGSGRAPARPREPKAPAGGKGKAEPKRAKDEAALRAAAEERARARTEARATEREARRRAERAVRAAEMAGERRDRAAQVLEEAERAFADADRERAEAEAKLQEAERAVRDLA